MEFLLECRQYLIKGEESPDLRALRIMSKAYLEDFILGDGVTWAEYRLVVTDDAARRCLPFHRVEVGKGETAIPAKYE